MNIDKLCDQFTSRYALSVSANTAFHKLMQEIVKENHLNPVTFSERTSLSPMFFTRLTRPNENFTLRIIVTVCVGLDLDTGLTDRLLLLMGLSFSPTKRLDCLYRFLVENCKGMTIEECNEFLMAEGVQIKDLLGSQEREKERMP